MLNFGPSSVVLPVYFTSIMRASPLARQGFSEVPTPLEPLGQSSRSLGAGSGVGVGAGATTAALGVGAAAFFSAGSSSQLHKSAAKANASRGLCETVKCVIRRRDATPLTSSRATDAADVAA